MISHWFLTVLYLYCPVVGWLHHILFSLGQINHSVIWFVVWQIAVSIQQNSLHHRHPPVQLFHWVLDVYIFCFKDIDIREPCLNVNTAQVWLLVSLLQTVLCLTMLIVQSHPIPMDRSKTRVTRETKSASKSTKDVRKTDRSYPGSFSNE